MIHKIMVGLFDTHRKLGYAKAMPMIFKMVDYFLNRIRNVIRTYTYYRWQEILTVEYGGMNEFMYNLYR